MTVLSEHQLQRQVAAFLDRALPADAWWTSIDSAGRGPVQGARMKARGVKRGLPDVLILWGLTTLWVELKSAKGVVSAEQKQFHSAAYQAGHHWTVCRSVEQLAGVLDSYRIPLRCRIWA